MFPKLSKKEQLELIQHLRYGPEWRTIKQTLLPYEYTLPSSLSSQGQGHGDGKGRKIWYRVGDRGQERIVVSQGMLESKVKEVMSSGDKEREQVNIKRSKKNKIYANPGEYQQYEIEDRYFSTSTTCPNCQQPGHRPQTCPNQLLCQFCLCPHSTPTCQHSKLCLQCYKLGHEKQACPETEPRQYCNNCQRKHILYKGQGQGQGQGSESQCYALAKNAEEKKQLFLTDSFYGCGEILCVRCRRFGHLCCGRN